MRSWRPYDAAPAVRAVGGLRRGVLLGALAGVETAAVMGCGGGAGSRACTPHRSLHTAECPAIRSLDK